MMYMCKGYRCRYCESNQHGHEWCPHFSHNVFLLFFGNASESQAAPSPPTKIVDVPSPSPASLIEILASLNATSDSLQQVHSCPLDERDIILSDIYHLFVESLSDHDDNFEDTLLSDVGSHQVAFSFGLDSLVLSQPLHATILTNPDSYPNKSHTLVVTVLESCMVESQFSIGLERHEYLSKPFILIPSYISLEWEFSSVTAQGFYLPKGRGIISCKGTYYSIRFATFCIDILSLLCEGTTSHFLQDLLWLQDIVT